MQAAATALARFEASTARKTALQSHATGMVNVQQTTMINVRAMTNGKEKIAQSAAMDIGSPLYLAVGCIPSQCACLISVLAVLLMIGI